MVESVESEWQGNGKSLNRRHALIAYVQVEAWVARESNPEPTD